MKRRSCTRTAGRKRSPTFAACRNLRHADSRGLDTRPASPVYSVPRFAPRSTWRKPLGRGYSLPPVAKEPASKRAVAFIDGQNLYYAAKEAFGYGFPNYDVHALAARICKA